MKLKSILLSAGVAAGAYILGHRTGFKRCAEKVLAVVSTLQPGGEKNEDAFGDHRNEKYELKFDSRSGAEEFLESMNEIVKRYGVVTVCDIKDLTGEEFHGMTFKDNLFGWTKTDGATTTRIASGFALYLEQPMDLREIDI